MSNKFLRLQEGFLNKKRNNRILDDSTIVKKSLFFLKFLLVIFLVFFQSNASFGQYTFKFDNMEVISDQFDNNVNQKQFDLTILGLENISKVQELEERISNCRGVVSFTIGERLQYKDQSVNEYPASITLYKYADHWMYYKFLFINNGIENVIFDDQVMNSENLSTL